MKVLFLHGLDSSSRTNKFSVISDKYQKVCETIDYRELSYDEVMEEYSKLIRTFMPDVLVGHSLGGYWALTLSEKFKIPVIAINFQPFPNFKDDYPEIVPSELSPEIYRDLYLELGDEVLDVQRIVKEFTGPNLITIPGGHHRVENLDVINDALNRFHVYEMVE